jgi:hypothetical protein
MWLNKNHSTINPPGMPRIHAKRYFISFASAVQEAITPPDLRIALSDAFQQYGPVTRKLAGRITANFAGYASWNS